MRGSQLAYTLALIVALLLLAAPAAAADAPRLTGAITDLSGVITDKAAIEDALTRLYNETGTQLYVLYLPTLDGEDINDFVDRVDKRNAATLSPRDALLVIATEDRDLSLASGADLDAKISGTELDHIRDSMVVPRLQDGDWAGGAVAAANGLLTAIQGDVVTAPEGKGGIPVIPIVIIIALAAIGIFLWSRLTAAKRHRAEAQNQEELGRKASSLLVSTDEALRKADQEIGYAEAQFGTDEAKALSTALAAAKDELAAAFKISTLLDDETPETPEQRRQMLEEIVARCEKANAGVADQKQQIDALRDLARNVEQVLPQVDAQAAATDARVAAGRQAIAGFSAYAKESWTAVAGNADAAAAKVATARKSLEEAKAAVGANRRDDAAKGARAAETALADAGTLWPRSMRPLARSPR